MKRKPIAAVEFLPRRFYFVLLHTTTSRLSLRHNCSAAEQRQSTSSASASLPTTPGIQCIALDEHLTLVPSPRSTDVSSSAQFHALLARVLDGSFRIPSDASDSSAASRRASACYFYVQRTSAAIDAHVIHLICQWRLVHLALSVQDAIAPFEHMPSLFPTMQLTRSHHGSSSAPLLPNLRVSLAGIAKGLALELLGAGSSASVLQQIAEQRHQRCGDASERDALAWVTKCLIILSDSDDADPTHTVATRHAQQLKRQHVTLVIRLETPQDSSIDTTNCWTALGIKVVDLVATTTEAAVGGDTSTLHDSSAALARFLDVCESTTGVTAVLTQRGSGRAATFLGCYLMKHLQFTSREAFGWLHWCGVAHLALHHQLFLDRMQLRMWRDGDAFRQTQQSATASEETPDAADALQISIGSMSLTRDSLFGTKGDKTQQQLSSRSANGAAASHAHSSREPHAPASSSNTATQQQPLKRRPLTQGSTVRRPRIQSAYRSSESNGLLLRADFAQMHKFLHQAGGAGATVATPRGSSASESVRAAAATALPSVHTS